MSDPLVPARRRNQPPDPVTGGTDRQVPPARLAAHRVQLADEAMEVTGEAVEVTDQRSR
ncbi:hypothetical protein BH23ACT2_BH23ACT2_31480 [soil metagenome]